MGTVSVPMSIGSGSSKACGFGSGLGIRIRIEEGKNGPQKSSGTPCFEKLDVLFGELEASAVALKWPKHENFSSQFLIP